MYRLLSAVLGFGVAVTLCMRTAQTPEVLAASPLPEPVVTLLNLHPVEAGALPDAKSLATSVPKIVRQGEASTSDARQVQVPAVVTVAPGSSSDPEGVVGKTGTGFFVSGDGTTPTAAHVANGCGRMQIISKYVPRTWVSLVASDTVHDVALLKAPGLRSPAVVHLASAAPTGGKLFVSDSRAPPALPSRRGLGPSRRTRNSRPTSVRSPTRATCCGCRLRVTQGYSGGPIFDPQRAPSLACQRRGRRRLFAAGPRHAHDRDRDRARHRQPR